MTSWEIHEGRSFVFCRQSPGTLAWLTTEGRRLRELIVGRVHIGILRHRQSKRHSRSRVCNSTDGISQSDSTRSEHVGIETRLALMAVSYSLQHPRVLVPGFRIEVDHHAASISLGHPVRTSSPICSKQSVHVSSSKGLPDTGSI